MSASDRIGCLDPNQTCELFRFLQVPMKYFISNPMETCHPNTFLDLKTILLFPFPFCPANSFAALLLWLCIQKSNCQYGSQDKSRITSNHTWHYIELDRTLLIRGNPPSYSDVVSDVIPEPLILTIRAPASRREL
jgi:hypothetical protein